jgi:hypothetical protein
VEDREAQEIVRMVESAWRIDYGPEGRKLWRDMLLPYKPDLAVRATAILSQRQRERPTIADLRQVILSLRKQEIEAEGWRQLPAEKPVKPAWVKRWEKARAAGDTRVFPEQIPGYIDLQKDKDVPMNAIAYALPETAATNEKDWVQEHEYTEET